MDFSRQQYWSGLPFPTERDLPNPVIEPACLTSPALAGRFFTTSATWEAQQKQCRNINGLTAEWLLRTQVTGTNQFSLIRFSYLTYPLLIPNYTSGFLTAHLYTYINVIREQIHKLCIVFEAHKSV